MPIFSIDNVSVLKDNSTVASPARFSFVASPGNIVEAEMEPTTVIDGTGCTLIPGLIDSKIDADSAIWSLATFAAYGVTTVIDLSSGTAAFLAMSTAAAQSNSLPSYLAAGSAIGVSTSESMKLFPFRAVRHATTPREADQLVSELATGSHPTDYIKVIADSPGLDDATLAAAVTAAHRHGKLAIAHASQTKAFRRARDAGFDIVSPVPIDGELDADTIADFAKNNIAVIPTLSFLHKALRNTTDPDLSFSRAMAAVLALHEAGVRICAGTSANKDGEMAVAFGESLHEELELLAQAGMSNAEVLRAATCVPADVFKLHDRGKLQAGYRADLVLVEGDPLIDISHTRRIKKVWIAGVEVRNREQAYGVTMDWDGGGGIVDGEADVDGEERADGDARA